MAWNLPEDAHKEGLQYPNFSWFKSPSGHEYIFDDTPGKETVTISHRSGNKIQMQPDGSLVVITKKNSYSVVFGDSNVLITGSENVTINGGCNLKVEGDMNTTIKGNLKHTVEGDMETIVNGNHTIAIKGNSETVIGENQSTKVAGKMEVVAQTAGIGATGNLGIFTDGGNVQIESGSDVNVVSAGKINLDQ